MRGLFKKHLKRCLHIIVVLYLFKITVELAVNEEEKQTEQKEPDELVTPKLKEDPFSHKKRDDKENLVHVRVTKEDGKGFPDEDIEYDKEPDPQDFRPQNAIKEEKDGRLVDKIDQKSQDERGDTNGMFFAEREKIYHERRSVVDRVCHRARRAATYGSLKSAPLHRLRWLVSRNLVMCFNAKVGTSTWTQYLLEVAQPGLLKNTSKWHYTAQKILKPPHKRYSEESEALLGKFRKVMLVRHPFARILSAFLDKVATRRFGKLCKYIIQRYRPPTSPLNSQQPTFEEFVRFLVESTPRTDDIRAKRDHRTDRHWFQYYANCAPCDISYDVIAKMETIHEDTRYIMKKYKLGLSDTVWNNHRKASKSSEDMALSVFKNLPRNLTLELYQRYKLDFLMFEYNLTGYLADT